MKKLLERLDDDVLDSIAFLLGFGIFALIFGFGLVALEALAKHWGVQ